jgi:hypothetical protein
MRKLGLALISILALGLGISVWGPPAHTENVVGPTNLIICNKVVAVNVVTAATTSVVAGVTGQNISICGWQVTSNQTTSTQFQFTQGTQGGPCTSPTNITGNMYLTSNAPSSDHQQYAYYSLPQGAQLCVTSTGATVGLGITFWYVQF